MRFARGGYLQGGFGDGFLSINTKYLSLFHIGSTWTGTVGHISALHGVASDTTNLNFPQNAGFLVQEGAVIDATGVATSFGVTFPTSYKTTPVVFVHGADPHVPTSATTAGFAVIGVSSVSTGGFLATIMQLQILGSGSSLSRYIWRAEGIAPL